MITLRERDELSMMGHKKITLIRAWLDEKEEYSKENKKLKKNLNIMLVLVGVMGVLSLIAMSI